MFESAGIHRRGFVLRVAVFYSQLPPCVCPIARSSSMSPATEVLLQLIVPPLVWAALIGVGVVLWRRFKQKKR